RRRRTVRWPDGPFVGSATSLTQHRLLGCRRLHQGVYVAPGVRPDALMRARAAWLYAGGGAVLAGPSAAAVLGARYLDGDAPAEMIRPRRGSRRTSGELVVRHEDLPAHEQCRVHGMRVTSPARTAFDLGRDIAQQTDAVVVLDALFAATDVTVG